MPQYTIIGASGLIGSFILQELLQHSDATIHLLVRRNLGIDHPRVKEWVIDFTDQQAIQNAIAGSDAVFIAIGTTQQKVKGDAAAYRKVDYDIPVSVAKACAVNQIPKLLLVSSVGADSRSRNFYLKLKGEVENVISAMSIPYVGFFQPSLLLGARQEFRLGEKISQALMPVFSFLIPAQYKPIQAAIVAKAMVKAACKHTRGVERYTYRGIKSLSVS
jgi:uncharacterized protein YbjT (DUF2867 family)